MVGSESISAEFHSVPCLTTAMFLDIARGERSQTNKANQSCALRNFQAATALRSPPRPSHSKLRIAQLPARGDFDVPTWAGESKSRFRVRDPIDLGRWLARILARGGLARWCWAQALLAAYEEGRRKLPRLTQTKLGERVASAAGGACPKWKVCRALKAARRYPQPPHTPAKCAAFSRVFDGHEPAAPAKNVPLEVRVRRMLKSFGRVVTKALRLGCTPREIRRWLDAELLSVVDAQKMAPPPALASPVTLPMNAETQIRG
jgi:hypothetical protein